MQHGRHLGWLVGRCWLITAGGRPSVKYIERFRNGYLEGRRSYEED